MTFELIPTVRMESQHSTGLLTCHDFPRFVFISEKSRSEAGSRDDDHVPFDVFGKETPYGHIFTNVFQKGSCRRGNTSYVQIS